MRTPMERVRDRYQNDPAFHAYVDMSRHVIEELQLTPSEAREAVMLAAIMVEERSFRPLTVLGHHVRRTTAPPVSLSRPREDRRPPGDRPRRGGR